MLLVDFCVHFPREFMLACRDFSAVDVHTTTGKTGTRKWVRVPENFTHTILSTFSSVFLFIQLLYLQIIVELKYSTIFQNILGGYKAKFNTV